MLIAALLLSLTQLVDEKPHRPHELTFAVRVSIPGGEASDTKDWSDFLSPGIGLGVQYSWLPKASESLYFGPYAGISVDSYEGKEEPVVIQPVGNATVEPDSLETVGLEFGARIRKEFGKFFVDANVGIGVTFYTTTHADITAPGVTGDAEAISASTAFLAVFGARFGLALSERVNLAAGVAFQINGAPDVGKDFTGFNFKNQENVVISLSLDIAF